MHDDIEYWKRLAGALQRQREAMANQLAEAQVQAGMQLADVGRRLQEAEAKLAGLKA